MTTTIEVSRLRTLIVNRLAQGYDIADAELMADSVLFGELIGRPSHGISRLLPGSYGAMDEEPGPPPVFERLGPSSARIRGRPGILVATMATQLVAELASKTGVAAVATTGSRSTSGSLTYYVELLTNQGMIALVATNTLSLVTPPGGRERVLGTNPIALGIPALGHPFVVDLATSAVTGGEVIAAAKTGSKIDGGVAVDAEGRATDDPRVVLDGGALLPFGGHKGLGLSMAVQILTGLLGGTPSLPITRDDDWSHVLVAVDLAAFGDPLELRTASQRMIDRLASTDAKEDAKIRIPGHRSLISRDEALARGTVEVDEDILGQIIDLLSDTPDDRHE